MTPAHIVDLFRTHGALSYDGEGITQLQHAWQCGRLAAAAGAPPAVQLAAWLHDLGHLMSGLPGSPTTRGIDDVHEQLGAAALRPLFGEAVAGPVALHVAAKRYLVATRPEYRERLSPDSRRSLALQGGAMDREETLAFRALPHAEDALRVRTWDDLGKRAEWRPRDDEAALGELRALIARVQHDAAAT
jgi:phosphonate degradation associated HDIG domain protein